MLLFGFKRTVYGLYGDQGSLSIQGPSRFRVPLDSGFSVPKSMSHKFHFTLADDDPDVLFLAHTAIEEFYPGSSFASFSNAEDALQHILATPTDILITNHGMGVMSGTELIATLRQRGFKLPIIMVSGHNDNEEEAKKVGADLFLPKSASYVPLVNAIKSLLPPS